MDNGRFPFGEESVVLCPVSLHRVGHHRSPVDSTRAQCSWERVQNTQIDAAPENPAACQGDPVYRKDSSLGQGHPKGEACPAHRAWNRRVLCFPHGAHHVQCRAACESDNRGHRILGLFRRALLGDSHTNYGRLRRPDSCNRYRPFGQHAFFVIWRGHHCASFRCHHSKLSGGVESAEEKQERIESRGLLVFQRADVSRRYQKSQPRKGAGFSLRFLDFARNDRITSLEAADPYAFWFCLISAWAAARWA